MRKFLLTGCFALGNDHPLWRELAKLAWADEQWSRSRWRFSDDLERDTKRCLAR